MTFSSEAPHVLQRETDYPKTDDPADSSGGGEEHRALHRVERGIRSVTQGLPIELLLPAEMFYWLSTSQNCQRVLATVSRRMAATPEA